MVEVLINQQVRELWLAALVAVDVVAVGLVVAGFKVVPASIALLSPPGTPRSSYSLVVRQKIDLE